MIETSADLERELRANDALECPFSAAQLNGLVADLKRARAEFTDQPEQFLGECLRIHAVWAARAGRKYASDRIVELRRENGALWQELQSLQQRLEPIERLLLSSGGSRH